jgi:Ca2+-binding RTX toxin-like protein
MKVKLTTLTLVSAAALGLLATPALASTATVSAGSRVNVNGQGNERNQLAVAYDAGTDAYIVTDVAGVDATGACTGVDATTATCPAAGIASITVNGGGGSDLITLDAATIPRAVEGDLDGGSGNDRLTGSTADDALAGSSGEDSLIGGAGADEIRGGSDRDTGFYADRTTRVIVTVGSGDDDDGNEVDQSGNARDTVRSDVEVVVGGSGPDLLIGDTSSESLIGGFGNDTLFGRRGNDALLGDAGNDFLSGEEGHDTLLAFTGNDVLLGGDEGDRLGGGPGNDFLRGDRGSDALKGKAGNDRINARDGVRDFKITCGPGKREKAKFDKRLDPRPKSC